MDYPYFFAYMRMCMRVITYYNIMMVIYDVGNMAILV